MWRLSAVTVVGLFVSFLALGGELSPSEKAELDALRASRTSVVTTLTNAFAPSPRRDENFTPTLAMINTSATDTSFIEGAEIQLASYSTPATAGFAATTSVTDPSKLAALTKPEMILREVTARRVNVRSGPSTSNPVLGQVVKAEIVRVLSNPNDPWVQISIEGDGIEGFISSKFLAALSQ
ncbi:SH3 domain-containing protein [Pacificibacter maritimus]|uniref:SH3 domain-containing protein n=1 Tax=Pacificibacter maritimus TaxID=762213 RepID=A0A3N4U8F1_9RHOB|nr:SH3 domain-containing protein [Pacificibacter maritimus]RPE63249.1 SH3 domain-containing protein [Pacificibacter maritimus]